MAGTGRVRRRHVFYLPGYDPVHPRRYRELYRRESAIQGAVSGYEIALRARTGQGPYGWHVTANFGEATVETEMEVLPWTDIVRDSMGRSIASTYLQLARTAFSYVGTGALGRLVRLRRGPVLAALYPVGFLLLQLALAVLAAVLLGRLFNWAAEGARLPLVDPWIGLLVGLAVIPLVLDWFRRHDARFYAYYLMHDYAYAARNAGAVPPELAGRITRFRSRIAEVLRAGEVDEVLVVGHSSGAHLAVQILAELLREEALPRTRPALALLTLGQVVPMVSFLPGAWRLRADLADLSARPELFWLDVSAPGDGCCFALCDPVAVSGVAPPGQLWPRVISAAFSRTLSPDRRQELRWRFFRLHFQYLCAFDRPGDYDYFRITAGPRTLEEAYRDRPPSPGRISTPVNRHRSLVP
ncbi:hypothetical protein KM176_07245 [Pseudooceanicola sp. CBS1P-1]|uniref:Alpha/beta hydrolase n=1 Tax=Pseudooceanicola albus TaxID=2692189 RepID=A0A6L7G1C6_9RHOB|nr:hypothetical protein [Pseudooceanicola endophyticus]MXN17502.1 hypothetical protein [Pseudooceanicola albus]